MAQTAGQSKCPEAGAPPATGFPKTRFPAPSSDTLLPGRARHLRRRVKSLPFHGTRSGPATPLLRWKLDDSDPSARAPEPAGPDRMGHCQDGSASAGPSTVFSARKLATALWHLHVEELRGGGRESSGARLGFESYTRNLHYLNVCDHGRRVLHSSFTNELVSPMPPSSNVTFAKKNQLEPSATFVNLEMEKATKWDHRCLRSLEKVYPSDGHLKQLKDQLPSASTISNLQTELEQAHYRICKLENDRASTKKKLDQFLTKLADEKASWKSREHKKVGNILDTMKDDLNRERKYRKRIEIMNSKLVDELAEVRLSAKQYSQDYEKERKARELIEEVCDQLAKEIGDGKSELESLKKEAMKIREELDEERRMLQMAEVWREERVQMKLVDAKITLEEKYASMDKLHNDLQAFLRRHVYTNANMLILKEAEVLREAVSSLKLQDIEFHYQQPPSSGDIFLAFEELQRGEVVNERYIGQCIGDSPASHASKSHAVSPETDIFLENPMKIYANGMSYGDMEVEDHSDLETMSYDEGQGSCNSHEGSNPCISGIHEDSHPNSGSSEICSRTTTRQSRNKVSSLSNFWRSSCRRNTKKKKTPVGSNLVILNATLSPEMNYGEIDPSSPSVGMRRSSDLIIPRSRRGRKGAIDNAGRKTAVEEKPSKGKNGEPEVLVVPCS